MSEIIRHLRLPSSSRPKNSAPTRITREQPFRREIDSFSIECPWQGGQSAPRKAGVPLTAHRRDLPDQQWRFDFNARGRTGGREGPEQHAPPRSEATNEGQWWSRTRTPAARDRPRPRFSKHRASYPPSMIMPGIPPCGTVIRSEIGKTSILRTKIEHCISSAGGSDAYRQIRPRYL